MSAVASTAEREYYGGYEPEEEEESGQNEAANSRALNIAQNLARKKAIASAEDIKQEAFRQAAELAKQRARQMMLRRVSWAFAASLVGLIVAYLIMTAQMILGNWLKVSGVPPLELWEQIVWGVVSLIILLTFILFFGLLMIILRMALSPADFLAIFGQLLQDWFGNIIGNIIGT
ncbi:MAG: hypothetical protein PHO91_02690 [Patescibacteria group bacterium]|nr:hypothetical protein [Patescibacteria group bacterium]